MGPSTKIGRGSPARSGRPKWSWQMADGAISVTASSHPETSSTFTFRPLEDGRWELVAIAMTAVGVRASDVRAVPVEGAWRLFRRSVAPHLHRCPDGRWVCSDRPGLFAPPPTRKERAADSRTWTDARLADLCRRYVELLPLGEPVAQLARERAMAPKTVRNLIADARRRHLITKPSHQGTAGGRLTTRAIRLLRDQRGDRRPR